MISSDRTTWTADQINGIVDGVNAITPLDGILRSTAGIQAWNYYPSIASTGQALTSQTIYAFAVPYRQGQVVTNIGFNVQQAASGTAPTSIFVGLSNATTMLMDSANQKDSSAWTSTGLRTVPLSSVYTIPSDGIYYHLILENGVFGSTVLQVYRAPGFAASDTRVNATGSYYLYATAGTGQTGLPAVGAGVTLASTGSPVNIFTFST